MYKVIFISNNRPKRFFRQFNTLSELAKYICENPVKIVRSDRINIKEMNILYDKVMSIKNKEMFMKNAKEDTLW